MALRRKKRRKSRKHFNNTLKLRVCSRRTRLAVRLAGSFLFARPTEPERSHSLRPGTVTGTVWLAVGLFIEWGILQKVKSLLNLFF